MLSMRRKFEQWGLRWQGLRCAPATFSRPRWLKLPAVSRWPLLPFDTIVEGEKSAVARLRNLRQVGQVGLGEAVEAIACDAVIDPGVKDHTVRLVDDALVKVRREPT